MERPRDVFGPPGAPVRFSIPSGKGWFFKGRLESQPTIHAGHNRGGLAEAVLRDTHDTLRSSTIGEGGHEEP